MTLSPFYELGKSFHGCHSSREAQLALSPSGGLKGRAADRGAKNTASTLLDDGVRWWAALVVVLHRGAIKEWEHGGTGLLGLSCLRRFDGRAVGRPLLKLIKLLSSSSSSPELKA